MPPLQSHLLTCLLPQVTSSIMTEGTACVASALGLCFAKPGQPLQLCLSTAEHLLPLMCPQHGACPPSSPVSGCVL